MKPSDESSMNLTEKVGIACSFIGVLICQYFNIWMRIYNSNKAILIRQEFSYYTTKVKDYTIKIKLSKLQTDNFFKNFYNRDENAPSYG